MSDAVGKSDGGAAKGTVTLVERQLPGIVERLARELDPVRIVLFGSHARGEASASSDIDLLVVLRELPLQRKREVLARMLRLLADLPVSVDVVPTDLDEIRRRGEVPGTVLRRALREGRVVYDRTA